MASSAARESAPTTGTTAHKRTSSKAEHSNKPPGAKRQEQCSKEKGNTGTAVKFEQQELYVCAVVKETIAIQQRGGRSSYETDDDHEEVLDIYVNKTDAS